MNTLSILFVEDNDDLRETLGMLIEAPGREVVLCATGEEALRHIARRRFDIVFTDLRMPGISGLELARRLLRDDARQHVVLCSGDDLDPALDALGPNVTRLGKPFDVDEVERLLDKALRDSPSS